MFQPKIVGPDGNLLNRAKIDAESPFMTEAEVAQVMEILGCIPIDGPFPERAALPRPPLGALYQCLTCAADEPLLATQTCDLCCQSDVPCHHNPRDGYVCQSCAAGQGICRTCGTPKPPRRPSRR